MPARPPESAPAPSAAPAATAAPSTGPGPGPDLPAWKPVSSRERLLLIGLAVLVAVVIAVLMAGPKLALMAARAARGELPSITGLGTDTQRLRCPEHAASIAPGCPGSKMNIVVVPARPATAASR